MNEERIERALEWGVREFVRIENCWGRKLVRKRAGSNILRFGL